MLSVVLSVACIVAPLIVVSFVLVRVMLFAFRVLFVWVSVFCFEVEVSPLSDALKPPAVLRLACPLICLESVWVFCLFWLASIFISSVSTVILFPAFKCEPCRRTCCPFSFPVSIVILFPASILEAVVLVLWLVVLFLVPSTFKSKLAEKPAVPVLWAAAATDWAAWVILEVYFRMILRDLVNNF